MIFSVSFACQNNKTKTNPQTKFDELKPKPFFR